MLADSHVKNPLGTEDAFQEDFRRQLIDDLAGVTLASASSTTPEIRSGNPYGGNVKVAKVVGKKLAEAAKAKGILKAAFDRGHYRYHGRVKALADAAREGGLQF